MNTCTKMNILTILNFMLYFLCYHFINAMPHETGNEIRHKNNNFRHKHYTKHIKHLRDRLDRVNLMQKTDHLTIESLKSAFIEMQQKFEVILSKNSDNDVGDHLSQSKEELFLSDFVNKDEVTNNTEGSSSPSILIKEIETLRNEIMVIKKTCPCLISSSSQFKNEAFGKEKSQYQNDETVSTKSMFEQENRLPAKLTKTSLWPDLEVLSGLDLRTEHTKEPVYSSRLEAIGVKEDKEDKESKAPIFNSSTKTEDLEKEEPLFSNINVSAGEVKKKDKLSVPQTMHHIHQQNDSKKMSSRSLDVIANKSSQKPILQWVLDVLPRMELNVEELQRSSNVLTALHDNEEINTKIAALKQDIRVMQHEISVIRAKSESTLALVTSTNEDVADGLTQLHKADVTVSSLKEKVDEQGELITGILSALPDGFLSENQNTMSEDLRKAASKSFAPISNAALVEKISHLEQKLLSIDFALMNVQKKVYHQPAITSLKTKYKGDVDVDVSVDGVDNKDNGESSYRPDGKTGAADRIDLKLQLIEDELERVKRSSVDLLSNIAKVEVESEKQLSEVKSTLSKVEQKVERSKEDLNTKEDQIMEEHRDILQKTLGLDGYGEIERTFARAVSGEMKKLMRKDYFQELCFGNVSQRLDKIEKILDKRGARFINKHKRYKTHRRHGR